MEHHIHSQEGQLNQLGEQYEKTRTQWSGVKREKEGLFNQYEGVLEREKLQERSIDEMARLINA